MHKVFIGYDWRQPISINVLMSSLYTKSSQPLAITPLVLPQLPIKRQGLTPFTYSRFLVPFLCNYEGWALFMDLDMLALDDVSKLFDMADDKYAVMVCKNKLKFEWASLMLFNCAKCKVLTPSFIEAAPKLHDCSFVEESEIGELPLEWNVLCGYDEHRTDAKIVHYTQGVPAFQLTQDCDYAQEWFEAHKSMNSTASWETLMGNSVHAAELPDGRKIPKFLARKLEENHAA